MSYTLLAEMLKYNHKSLTKVSDDLIETLELWAKNKIDEKALHSAICDYIRSSNRQYDKDSDGPLFSETYSKLYKEVIDAVIDFSKEHSWKKTNKDSYTVLYQKHSEKNKSDVTRWHKIYITLKKDSSKDFFKNLTGELKSLIKSLEKIDDDIELHIISNFRLLYTEVDNVKILFKDESLRDKIKSAIFSKLSTEDRAAFHRTDDGMDFEDKTDTEHVADEVIEKIQQYKKKWKEILDDGYESNDKKVKDAFLKIIHQISENPEHRTLFNGEVSN